MEAIEKAGYSGKCKVGMDVAASEFKVEGELRRDVQQHVRHYIEIGSYRGSRHRRNLPARGQRTRTNGRTRRGRRRTVGSGGGK